MDYLKGLLGLRSSPEGSPLQYSASESLEQHKSAESITKVEERNKEDSIPSILQGVVKRFPWVANAFNLEEDDCISCKFIGVTVCMGCSAFVLVRGFKMQNQFKGTKKLQYILMYGSISTTFFLLATSRLFNVGVFQHLEEGKEKSIIQLMIDDAKDLKHWTEKHLIHLGNSTDDKNPKE